MNYNKGGKAKQYIVLHYTGNYTDTAIANSNYFKSVNRGASAHYFVDEEQIVQVVNDSDTAWSIGKNYGNHNLFGTVTNANSINIEMCSVNGKIGQATFENTVMLTKQLMVQYGIAPANVYRHYDICSKICPGWDGWVGEKASIWNSFKLKIGSTEFTEEVTDNSLNTKVKSIDVDYAVMVEGGKTMPFVRNLTDYAGLKGKRVVGFACAVSLGSIKYRVHLKNKGWLPYVTGCSWKDYENGYAGDGKTPVDALEAYLYSPNGNQFIFYRVSPLNGKFYSYQRDNEKNNYMDGYAGKFGTEIDRVQMYIEK